MASRSAEPRLQARRPGLRAAIVVLACAAGLAHGAALAAVFRDARYGEPAPGEPQARLVDVYTPGAPGPHPVLLLLHGAADKSAATALPVRLAARDYVVFNANHRAAPADAQADVVEALRHVARTASGYGGDARRVFLLGAGADAAVAARAATDPRANGGGPGTLAGLVLAGDPGPWPGGRAGAPALLLQAEPDRATRHSIEAWAQRLQRQGLSAQVVAVENAGGAGGVAGEPVLDAVDAWLSASVIPRVQRFENLVFAPDPGLDADPVVAFASAGRALYAAAGRAIWRRDPARVEWQREHEFALPIACLGRWSGRLHAVLADADTLATSQRHDDGNWSAPGGQARRAQRGPSAPICAAAPDGAYVADGRRLWQIDAGGRLQARLELPAAVSGLAVVDGALLVGVEASGGIGPALWRLASDGTAARVLTLPPGQAPWRHLLAVPDPEGGAREVVLGEQDGRLLRYDPVGGHAPVEELDLDAALRAHWGGLAPGSAARLSSDFEPLVQPETGDRVHVAGLAALHPRREAEPWRGAWYLVRDADGRYALGQAAAPDLQWPAAAGLAPIRAVAASPYDADGGRVAWFAGGSPAWIATGTLDRAGPWQGLWWNPAQPGHGLLLQREGGRWLALLYTYDDEGEPTWYRATLQADADELESDAVGLVEQRGPGADPAAAGLQGVGRLALRRGGAAIRESCAADHADASDAGRAVMALELRGREVEWCVQPFRFASWGLPRVAPRGLYGASQGDPRWGLYVETQGIGAAERSLALVFHFDEQGLPRWALGTGPSRGGGSEVELRRYARHCIGCEPRPMRERGAGSLLLRFAGYCGELRGAASLQLAGADARPSLGLRDIALAAVADAACY